MNEEEKLIAEEQKPRSLNKAKLAGYAGLAITLIGVTTFQSCQKQAQLASSIDAQSGAKVEAVLDYIGQKASSGASVQSGSPGTTQPLPEYSVSVVEQKASARDANLDRSIELMVGLVQDTNCTRVQFYLDKARSASSEQGISQEDWLLGQLNRVNQEMEAYALEVGYASDSTAIAATRSAFQEPLAVSSALRYLYSGKSPTCRPDALPATTIAREAYRDALAVRQLRREAIANDGSIVPAASGAIVADPAQSVDVVTTTGAQP